MFIKIARQLSVGGFVMAWCVIWSLLSTTSAQAAGTQVLHGHVPAAVTRSKPVGNFAGTNHLNLAIGLPLRNQEALTNLLRQIYDPASPNYHHFLTPEQFAEMFGPTEKDYLAVIAFAKANKLTVTGTHPNRILVDVSGSVANIEKAMHVTMRLYQHPVEKRMFHAPDAEPSLDLAVPVLSVSGLDNYSLPSPRFQATPLANAQNTLPNAGSGPSGAYMGKDFRAAYVPDSSLNGSGQIVGLLQFDGYTASDITYYENQAGLPNITLSNVLIDGATGNPSGGGGEVEVSLDIEMAISMATNLSKVIIYMAPNPSPWEDLLNRMANDNLAKQLSCSWYAPGSGEDPAADQIFQQMAAQGQSFFSASGDYDAFTGLIPFPGDTPYITQVGGTALSTTGPGGPWAAETVWNWGGGIGSAGGISTQYPIPSWQTNINMTVNQGSTTMRNTPDVALTADNVYVRADGVNHNVGGTSCAAPLWAGFTALVNQQAAASGKPTVGFINPAVDAICTGAAYTSAFHDITTGNNTSGSSPTKFYAVAGYDLCTGWGTPAGQNLINALANPEALLITPATGFSSAGGVGGPFTITSQSLTLTNAGTNSLTWMLVNTSTWLNTSPGGGTLTPGAAATSVTVSLNTAASNLLVGTYNATVWFTNLNNGVGQSRQFILSIINPPTITTQPTNQAVLEGTTAAFTVAATGGLPLSYQWQDNGTNLTAGGNIFGSTTTSLTINNVTTANVGTYSVIVSNAAGVVTSSNASLTITPSPPIIILQPVNQTAVVDQTAAFTVAVIGSTPYFYQWSFGGTNIVGATNTTLTLTNVQFNQAGNYAVLVTNAYGSILSSNAVLTVLPCVPAPSGLVDWWPGEGNANDVVGTNNGTLVGGVSYAAGEVGQAFSFDGTSGYVSIPDSPSLDIFVSSITVEAWIKVNQVTANSDWKGIVTKGNSSWRLQATSQAKTVTFSATGLSPNQDLKGSRNVNDGQWHHVAGVYDGTNMFVYVDGTLDTSQPATGSISQNSSPEWIGATAQQSYFFNGMVDEASLYNRALTASEIQAIYAAGSGGKCPPSPTPPSIATQPANQTVFVGGSATFSVTASGIPPLSFQWNFNGTNISGATNTSLTLTNVQFNQAGNYAVLVTNAYGSILSSNAVLTVLPCVPAPSGLVDWWPGEGNANDVVGTNNGTLVGGVSYAAGEVGQAFSFDGTSGYVSIPDSPSLDIFVSSITVEAWIKVNQVTANSDWKGIVTKGNSSWRLQATSQAKTVTFSATGLSPNQDLKGSRNVNDGQWHHVAGVYDGTNMFVYVDGTLDTSQPATGSISQNSSPEWIGATAQQSYFFNGMVDEASLYNRALTASEIQAIYAAGSGGKCPPSPTPPSIATQPANQTVFVGGSATFSVTASGIPPLSFQWNFNGTNISGATNTSLTLTNVQFNQAGNYAVLVTNAYGSILSSNAVLTVLGLPPSISIQPTNQTAMVGGSATFSVTASGTAPLCYQWAFNRTNISGATNTSLTLTNIQLNQAGNYSMLVTNLYGSILSSNALLTVNPLPSCDPAPSGLMDWWRGESNALDSAGTNNGTLVGGVSYVAGEVGQAFSFNGTSGYVSIPDSPSLDSFTRSITIEAWIKVNQFSSQDWIALVCKGDSSWQLRRYGLTSNLSFYTSGLNNPELQGNRNVNDGQWHHVAGVYDGTNKYLYVDGTLDVSALVTGSLSANRVPLLIGDNPEHTQRLFNGLIDEVSIYRRGLSASEIQAIYAAGSEGKCPLAPPSIITQPTNQTVPVGGTATFNVTAVGTPPLSYQWVFSGTNISGATNTSLILTNVQLSQAANYAVLVTNLYGSILSSNALLTVTLDHFAWNQILSPRFANTPFAVTIQARDLTNGLFTNFTGIAFLGTTNGVSVAPSASGNFVQGVWTGSVVISQTASNLVLRASDGLGHFGLANPLNVISLPSLGMWRSGNIALFMWPVEYSGFVLEASDNLSPAMWMTVPYVPIQMGDQYLLPLDMTATNGFYRLRFSSP